MAQPQEQLFYLEHINNYGAPTKIEGTEFYLHPGATESGGLTLPDNDNVSADGFKDIAAKLATKVMKGELADITHMEFATYMYSPNSHLGLVRNDMTFCQHLTKAA